MPIYEMDFKNWPKFVKDLLPKDLLEAYGNKQSENVHSVGRKSSIDKDNVNDLSYFFFKKRMQKYDDNLKNTDKTPIEYAYENSKIKCFCFIYKFDCLYDKEAPMMLKKFYDKLKDDENYLWLKYFCILNAVPGMFNADEIYDFILNTPNQYENLLIVANRYNEINAIKELQKRKNKDQKKDIAFYNSLSRKQKIEFARIVRIDKLDFEIEDAIIDEKDLETYFAYYYSTLRIVEYTKQFSLTNDFQKFVKNHQDLFNNFQNFKMIHPRYRGLYQIAFKNQNKSKFDNNNQKNEYVNIENGIIDYISYKLIPNKCIPELKYFISVGWKLQDLQVIESALKTLDDEIINLCDKSEIKSAMSNLLRDNYPYIFKLFDKGYYPSVYAVGELYGEHPLRDYAKNYAIIDALPKNLNLDDAKCCIATNYIEMVPEFIERYHNRFNSNATFCWHLSNASTPKQLEEACKSIGIENKEEVYNDILFDWFNDKPIRSTLVAYAIQNGADISDSMYLRKAINRDDLKIAAALIRAGASTCDIRKWDRHCSPEMYDVIMKNM